ncbi:hypothetical protein [Roseovarius amoyensis]|uniref:hypothetical protein n=1 Tax=Roseovarius amoyensis TaxID=2211448 RepID=UPI000DBE81BA|nr:hypothetical protein [Roseovarius amoyensis]
MRFISLLAAAAAVAACSPSIPDSAAGVSPLPPARAISDESSAGSSDIMISAKPLTDTTATASTDSTDPADIAAETQAALAAARANSGQVPLEASPNNPPPQTVETSTGISEENDFDAVDSVRSIESDAALIARNREQYQVIQPTALPSRSGASGPNIVSYALSTSHQVGTKVYTRIGINKQARFQRNCAKYASADLAQLDFLEKGGPERDRLGLDPDGDGFACRWDPTPFRMAVQN